MQLIRSEKSHLVQIMNWLPNAQATADWAGPNFRYPFDTNSFDEDLRLDTHSSFSLLVEATLVAFGQYYPRQGRCHLARLIVSPDTRGQGIASQLMQRLCARGVKELAVNECSLFVVSSNDAAIRAYRKFGFVVADYAGEIELENCCYMVRACSSENW